MEKVKIIVGEGLLGRAGSLVKPLGAKRAFLIVDARMQSQVRVLERSLKRAGWKTAVVGLTAKESTKDFRKIFGLYGKLIEFGMDRHSVLFAVGGGVIGDLAGFVAGTYLRGIRWVGVPTTLLAQVDSSIGGKTGVNHPLGKNLIGVFHQPSIVLCDTSVLQSLSPRDRVSGFGEIVKYGLVFDRDFFRFLVRNRESLLEFSPRVLRQAVLRSTGWKSKVVARDEKETRGVRALLNFGHTLGHALEGATGYGRFRHGEAILWGMRWAAALSRVRGHLDAKAQTEIDTFLASLPVPSVPRTVTLAKLLTYVKRDKKAKEGKVGFILLDRIGHAVVDSAVTPADIARALAMVKA